VSWIGVDLDGTLAHYDGWVGFEHIGEPIPLMVNRVKEWLSQGQDVRIFTDRATLLWEDGCETPYDTAIRPIEDWCERHLGQKLKVTCMKDMGCIQIWDDRAVRVEANTGRIV